MEVEEDLDELHLAERKGVCIVAQVLSLSEVCASKSTSSFMYPFKGASRWLLILPISLTQNSRFSSLRLSYLTLATPFYASDGLSLRTASILDSHSVLIWSNSVSTRRH